MAYANEVCLSISFLQTIYKLIFCINICLLSLITQLHHSGEAFRLQERLLSHSNDWPISRLVATLTGHYQCSI